MRKTAIILATLLLSSIGFAQTGAKIEFKHKNNTIDYGKIHKDKDNGVRVFEFSNTGNLPLYIYSVQSTTNCTVVSIPKKAVLPGKSDTIVIKYTMVIGPVRKTITVESNATNYPDGLIPLRIIGEVVK